MEEDACLPKKYLQRSDSIEPVFSLKGNSSFDFNAFPEEFLNLGVPGITLMDGSRYILIARNGNIESLDTTLCQSWYVN